MEIAIRNELIDTYYSAVDDADFDRMLTAFTEDVEYLYPGEEPMHGHGAVRTFFEERRKTKNTTHDVFRRVHDDTATVCEGTITGQMGEDSLDGAYVGVFEFDDDAGRISYVGVYTRL
ncbi:nuclear transport factor 2 family protein [Haloferax sp. YSMS24]|uniref:nuclear transport factor 2 family protein n=1 Tax=Haloferax sp. YSMS24 TaxID=3388425 RepID=UPI00398D6632